MLNRCCGTAKTIPICKEMKAKMTRKRSQNLMLALFFLSIMTTTAIAERMIIVGKVVAGPDQKKSEFIISTLPLSKGEPIVKIGGF
jgi:hypothetical protein